MIINCLLKTIGVKGTSDEMLTVVMQSVDFTRRDVNVLAISEDLAAFGRWLVGVAPPSVTTPLSDHTPL